MRLRTRTVRAAAAVLAAVALATGAAACSSEGSGNTIAEQAKKGDNAGYVAGDGAVEEVPAGQRGEPIQLQGTTLDGKPWNLADQRGEVVVLNVWGSWCQPCEAEAPVLEAVHVKKRDKPVQFMGINVGESPETGAAGAKAWGMTYPSISDPDRLLASSLNGLANATPTTLVLDPQGRVAGRISGPVTSEATLDALIEGAQAS